MTPDPEFLSEKQVREIHAEQLAAHGGAHGVLDENGFQSAVEHPQNVQYYQPECSIFLLAATYAFHIAKNHPFKDGNKRTGAACAVVFLRVNGWSVTKDFTQQMIAVAAGGMSKEDLSAELEKISAKSLKATLRGWLRRHS